MDAFYTDDYIVDLIGQYFPHFTKKTLRILEPSVGIGRFLRPIIFEFSGHDLIIDVVDIDKTALKKTREIYGKHLPKNVKINYIHDDFLSHNFRNHYDFIVGNPPFTYAREFLEKCLTLGDFVTMIMPKDFLSSEKFSRTREFIENYKIEQIFDLRESGFLEAKIETICLYINLKTKPEKTWIRDIDEKTMHTIEQEKITDKSFPYWLIYRDEKFDRIAEEMDFGIFETYRDRDIKNEFLSSKKTKEKNIWVVRSQNIKRNEIAHVEGYDRYISKQKLEKTKALKFLNHEAFIAPNLSKEIRVVKKPKNIVCNGSVAILIPKENIKISKEDLKYFSSNEFREFYDIATNKSTRTKNIDRNSVYFLGTRRGTRTPDTLFRRQVL